MSLRNYKQENQTGKRLRLFSKWWVFFITICTKDRKPILPQINVGEDIILPSLELSEYGKIVDKSINEIPMHMMACLLINT